MASESPHYSYRDSVKFGRQGAANVAGDKPLRPTTWASALSRCDIGSCFLIVLGFPTGVAQVSQYPERRPLKTIRSCCKAWGELSDEQRAAYGIDVAKFSSVKEGTAGWVNQDSILAVALPSRPNGGLSPLLFGVFDGHGRNGHEVSGIATDRLHLHLTSSELDPLLDPETALREACKAVDADVYTALGPDVEYSGSTAVICFYDPNKRVVHCANIGDSRAVLGRSPPTAQKWCATQLTEDLKPTLAEERHRIELSGGIVSAVRDRGGSFVGPERVWENLALEKPGLAVSRSLGDGCARSVGVIAEPVVTKHSLGPDDCILILGSDGVWDSISNEKVLSIASKFCNNLSIGVKAIVEAVRREEGGELVDDTSIILVRIPR